jgi:hypothetical protein
VPLIPVSFIVTIEGRGVRRFQAVQVRHCDRCDGIVWRVRLVGGRLRACLWRTLNAAIENTAAEETSRARARALRKDAPCPS